MLDGQAQTWHFSVDRCPELPSWSLALPGGQPEAMLTQERRALPTRIELRALPARAHQRFR